VTVWETTGVEPAPLAEKPVLDEFQADLLQLFWLLSESRPVGFGSASGITTVDILMAANCYGYEPTAFLRVIRALDRVFLQHLAEAAKRASEKNSH